MKVTIALKEGKIFSDCMQVNSMLYAALLIASDSYSGNIIIAG